MEGMTQTQNITPAPKPLWQRLIPVAAIIALMATAWGFGLQKYLTLQAIAENRMSLGDYTNSHWLLALLIFMAVYVLAVALSFPGASVLTILGGLLFGAWIGGAATVIAATIGAVLIFEIAKSALGEGLAKRAGPFLSRIKDGFAADAFNYLLFLRLVPAFPFWLVNIAPALANVRLRTFTIATALGIIPGTFAFSFIGAGLDSLITAQNAVHSACIAAKGAAACPYELSVSSLVTKELLLAFVALGVVSLIPVAIKKWKKS
jgi:uncharacterized membrane protein YdjX (TVP38/TMEM64 family)